MDLLQHCLLSQQTKKVLFRSKIKKFEKAKNYWKEIISFRRRYCNTASSVSAPQRDCEQWKPAGAAPGYSVATKNPAGQAGELLDFSGGFGKRFGGHVCIFLQTGEGVSHKFPQFWGGGVGVVLTPCQCLSDFGLFDPVDVRPGILTSRKKSPQIIWRSSYKFTHLFHDISDSDYCIIDHKTALFLDAAGALPQLMGASSQNIRKRKSPSETDGNTPRLWPQPQQLQQQNDSDVEIISAKKAKTQRQRKDSDVEIISEWKW